MRVRGRNHVTPARRECKGDPAFGERVGNRPTLFIAKVDVDERAGERLGGAVIPQGHPTGYPTYRLEWQSLGSLQRRIRGCIVGVRAEPFAADADESLALEVWMRRRAAGMTIEGVAVRP